MIKLLNATKILEQFDERRMQFSILILKFLLLTEFSPKQLHEERLQEDLM